MPSLTSKSVKAPLTPQERRQEIASLVDRVRSTGRRLESLCATPSFGDITWWRAVDETLEAAETSWREAYSHAVQDAREAREALEAESGGSGGTQAGY